MLTAAESAIKISRRFSFALLRYQIEENYMASTSIERLRLLREDAFRWRFELSLSRKLGLAAGMAVLTGLLAQVAVPLPWTPVPITGQTLAVLLAGVLLGGGWGGISQVIYAGLGLAGLPWFAGWQGGLSHLAGPTGGYIVGFVLAALCVGYFTDRFMAARQYYGLVVLMLAANFILIYVPGLLQLGLWLSLIKGQSLTVMQTLNLGLWPFVAGDVIKILLAAGIAWAVLPKTAFRRN
jgi:biotin transport system substrate-specific component